MNLQQKQKVYRILIKYYGCKHQLKKAIEELQECKVEIKKVLKGKGNKENLISEIADVFNTLNQTMIICNISEDEILKEMDRKNERQLSRMEENKNVK